MYGAAQRKHAIQSFDSLLRILLVYSYLIDPFFLRLVVRFVVQLQLSNPKELDPTASLRFYLGCLTVVHAGTLGRYLFGPVEADPGNVTLVLDFIGRIIPSTSIHIAILDFSIFFLQSIMLILAYETHDYREDSEDPLAPTLFLKPHDTSAANDTNEDEYAPLVPASSAGPSNHRSDLPVFHLRLSTTLQRIRQPPEPSPSEALNPNAAFNSSDRSPAEMTTRRLMGRAFRDIMQGRGGSGSSVIAANLPTGSVSTNDGSTRRIPGSLPSSSV